MNEFWNDFRANWRDRYWWLDHQALRLTLLSILGGLIGLLFHRAQLRMNERSQLRIRELADG